MKVFSAIVVVAFMMVGCSSKTKKDDKPTTPAATVGVGKTKTGADGKKRAEVTLRASSEGVITCKAGDDTRTLEVIKDDQGCKTIYNKAGAENEVASGNASGVFCQNTLEKIKANLETSGYTCD